MKKLLSLILFLICCNSTSLLAVNSHTTNENKKEVYQNKKAKRPLSLKQKVGHFILKKWVKQKTKKKNTSKKKKINIEAIASVFGGVLSAVIIVAAIAVSNILVILLAGLIAGLAFYFGLRGLAKARNESETYNGKGLSIIGICLNSLSLLVFLLVALWLIIIFGIIGLF